MRFKSFVKVSVVLLAVLLVLIGTGVLLAQDALPPDDTAEDRLSGNATPFQGSTPGIVLYVTTDDPHLAEANLRIIRDHTEFLGPYVEHLRDLGRGEDANKVNSVTLDLRNLENMGGYVDSVEADRIVRLLQNAYEIVSSLSTM